MAISGDTALRRTVLLVALLNLAFFAVETTVAWRSGSVSLLADSIDFLEDTAINVLVLVGLSLSARARPRLGIALAGIMLIPSLTAAGAAVGKLFHPLAPVAGALTWTALGALVVNVLCAVLLAAHRNNQGSMAKAAFLSARNDALANVAMVVAGLVTRLWPTAWPDLVLGAGILALNADAALKVYRSARRETSVAAQP